MRHLIHQMLTREDTPYGRWCSVAISSLIVLNVVAAIIETMPHLPTYVTVGLNTFEWFSILAFSAEYLLRFYSCVESQEFAHPIWGRIRYLLTPMAIIDLAVLLPFYLNTGLDVRTLRVIRLLRLVRLLRYDPYVKSLRGFGIVLKERRGDLMLCAMLSCSILLVSATIMYHCEREAQPLAMGSIPDCLWWAVIHLTTIGYGDVYPVTTAGKIVAGATALLGIGFVTLPSTIFAMAYVDHIGRERRKALEGDDSPSHRSDTRSG